MFQNLLDKTPRGRLHWGEYHITEDTHEGDRLILCKLGSPEEDVCTLGAPRLNEADSARTAQMSQHPAWVVGMLMYNKVPERSHLKRSFSLTYLQ